MIRHIVNKKIVWVKFSLIISATIISSTFFLFPVGSSGYQLSIFSNIPLIWKLSAIVICSLFLLQFIYTITNSQKSTQTMESIIIILPVLLISAQIMVLPQLQGYPIRYGDPATHIGDVKQIITNGYLPRRAMIYPAMHIIIGSISMLTNIEPALIEDLYKICIFLGFVLISIVTSRNLLEETGYFIVAFISLIIRVFDNPSPSVLSYSIFFILGIYLLSVNAEKITDRKKYVGLFVVISIGMWTSHHFVPILFLLVCSASIALYPAYTSRFYQMNILMIICTLVGFLWYLFNRLLSDLLFNIFPEYGPNQTQFYSAEDISSTLSGAGIEGIEILILGFKRFGSWGIILMIGLVILILSGNHKEYIKNQFLRFTLLSTILVSSIWSVVEFFIGFIPALNFTRLLRPAVLASVIGAPTIYNYINKNELKDVLSICVAVLLVFTMILSFASFYEAPWLIGGNTYATQSEVDSWEFYVENKALTKQTVTVTRNPKRMIEYISGSAGFQNRITEFEQLLTNSHFGYDSNEKITDESENYYLFIDQRSVLLTTEVGNTSNYNISDYERVQNDPSVSKIYSNNISTIYTNTSY